jgi:hypothetical protein
VTIRYLGISDGEEQASSKTKFKEVIWELKTRRGVYEKVKRDTKDDERMRQEWIPQIKLFT